MTKTKYPFIVYWYNKHDGKWQCCVSIDKALKLKALLTKQGINRIWIAKDI